MIAKPLTKLILRRYLHQVPQQLRWARFHSLQKVSWLKVPLEEIKPEVLPTVSIDAVEAPHGRSDLWVSLQPSVPHYPQYRCVQANPLGCYMGEAVASAHPQRRCDRCEFPAWLPPKGQLVGKKGQYVLAERLGHRGLGRQYSGVEIRSEKSVVIREYLLPQRYFSREEQREYQDLFTGVAGLALADGRSPDLRIVAPIEAIADPTGDRCYLVNPAIDNSSTLNRCCGQYGALTSQGVSHILNQVLQTLTCLHEQKFSLPNGQTKTGIVHGNISLDSLLWVHPGLPVLEPFPSAVAAPASPHSSSLMMSDGFIYLTDFSLWENLFDPTRANPPNPDHQQDLNALGEVAFSLLGEPTVRASAKSLNPRVASHWPEEIPASLKKIILRLIGIEAPFPSAEAARVALLTLSPHLPVNGVANESVSDYQAADILPEKPNRGKKILPFLVLLALLMLGSLGWLLLRSRKPSYAGTPLPPCCLEAVAAVPTGEYVHASPEAAYWYPLFRTTPESAGSSRSAPTLFDQLKESHPELSLKAKASPSVDDAIAMIQSGQTDLAIVPLTIDLPPDITATIIAYDTLVPVVAFSYPDRVKGLPETLKGEITLDQLKQIYTGQINHWQQLNSSRRSDQLPLKRYWLTDKTTQDFVAQRLLSTDQDSRFPGRTAAGQFLTNQSQPEALSAIPMMRSILQDFENRATGSIGISPLSEVVGQCSVYPLAISVEGTPVSPLVFDTGKTVTYRSDLCDRKGSYRAHAEAIRSGDYPLAYPLAVIYPFDNTRSNIGKKLAELLLTQSSQQQLMSAGMVSAYQLPSTEIMSSAAR